MYKACKINDNEYYITIALLFITRDGFHFTLKAFHKLLCCNAVTYFNVNYNIIKNRHLDNINCINYKVSF